jgi:hypothetical protein
MKRTTALLLHSLLGLAAAGARCLGAPDPSAAANHIFAQKLVNDACHQDPSLILVGIHAVFPGTTGQVMVACNLDRIGKKDSADDFTAATGHRIIGIGTAKQGKYVVLLPLKDARGGFTGAAVGIAFPFHAGEAEAPFYAKAIAIEERMAAQLTGAAQLFAPVSAP